MVNALWEQANLRMYLLSQSSRIYKQIGETSGTAGEVGQAVTAENSILILEVKYSKTKKIGAFKIVQNILSAVDLLKILKKNSKSELGVFKGSWDLLSLKN